jgi:hypothetical protein
MMVEKAAGVSIRDIGVDNGEADGGADGSIDGVVDGDADGGGEVVSSGVISTWRVR